eukprot:CAMPEP_0172677142 /NCGR_PEP_ID=MMETSP1074-20121228/14471_1 /TAXON_ID=2916 /ORGANISM="Ceratium fusus, Strain PA161109" /LENGTH=372 /DNA_ID=CAMNT_0013494927 /DNA_START=347 /DNA_END=1461 /DNA_ORIENTATION=+
MTMLVSLVFLCQWGGKKTSPGQGRGNLRLSRRQGDRNRAIKVHQESVSFLEECIFLVGDVFDAFVAGICELAGHLWNLFSFVCGAGASLSTRMSTFAGTSSSKVYAAFFHCGHWFRHGASRAKTALTHRALPKTKTVLATAQNGKKAARGDSVDAVQTTTPGVRKRGGRKDPKVCNVVAASAGQPASPLQDLGEVPRRQEVEVGKSASSRAPKAKARGNSTPVQHRSAASANVCEGSAQARHKSTSVACENDSRTPTRRPSAAEVPPQAMIPACENDNRTPMRNQSLGEVSVATDLADNSAAAHEDSSSSSTACLSGDVIEPVLRLSTDCLQTGDPPRADGAASKELPATCNLTPLRTFLGEPVPKVELRRT